MTTEPRAALDRLIAALEAHLGAAADRRGDDDPVVVAAYERLAAAFEVYDDSLYQTYDEATPMVLFDDEADALEDEDEEDDDDLEDDDDVEDDELDDIDEDDLDDEIEDELDELDDVDEPDDEDDYLDEDESSADTVDDSGAELSSAAPRSRSAR